MTDRLITHVRHVDLAVPDYDTEREFYTNTWGLTVEAEEPGVTYLAAEGSPEQYIVRLRKDSEKRMELWALGARDAAAVDTLAERLAQGGVQLVNEPGKLQTPGGGYGFRFFDADGRTVEISSDVAVRQHRKIEEKESIPVRLSHVVINSPDPDKTRAFYENLLGFRAVRHPLQPAHGRGDVVPAHAATTTTTSPSPAARTSRCTTCRSRCAAWTSTCAAPAG